MKHLIFDLIKKNRNLILLVVGLVPIYAIMGCPIRYITGICCPGCGMTRACFALAGFDFGQALYFHPLVIFMPVAVLVCLLRRRIPKKLMTALCIVAIVMLSVVYVIRLSGGSEIVYWDFEKGAIYKLFHIIVN